MKIKFFLLLFIVTASLYAQDDDDDGLILGKNPVKPTAAVYDLSDPQGVNIEVNLWGFVRFPGRYIIPNESTFMDLMSFAGGPLQTTNLREIRIIRNPVTPGEKPRLIKLNYDDLLWEEKISNVSKVNPELKSGDVILILEEKRYSFREDIGFFLPIITSILTIATFIITLSK